MALVQQKVAEHHRRAARDASRAVHEHRASASDTRMDECCSVTKRRGHHCTLVLVIGDILIKEFELVLLCTFEHELFTDCCNVRHAVFAELCGVLGSLEVADQQVGRDFG